MELTNQKPSVDSKALDSAFGQNLITINEFRSLLGLPPIENGDKTKSGKTLSQQWT